MKKIIKYAGTTALSVSLIMLSLGSIPTSYAQSVGSQMTVTMTCGINLTGPTNINWDNTILFPDTLDNTQAADHAGSEPTVQNPGTNSATTQVKAAVGDSSTGGYRGTVDGVTHISPTSMQLDLINGAPSTLITMSDSNSPQQIGTLAPAENDELRLVVNVPPVAGLFNKPITDQTWTATITLTATCAIV